ncbi:hypothetical protein NKI30_00270 [Mesorhizobium opportunistum]|uniref:hypothetical protein n=1 Tax=Mesorhizobium opportunistum TaxID=593909 RepID=UPI00333A6803
MRILGSVGVDSDEGQEAVEAEATGLSAALTEALTPIRTAALRVELANRRDVALVAVLHALVMIRVFYDYPHGRIEPVVEVTGQRRNLVPSIKEPDACLALIGGTRRWRAGATGCRATLPTFGHGW